MQNSTISTRNPNQMLGLWVEDVTYPALGVGQVQSYDVHRQSCIVEDWQKPVLNNLSFNGLLYPYHRLRHAQYHYVGRHGNALYYVHHGTVWRMDFEPTPGIWSVADFAGAGTSFYERRAYMEAMHLEGWGDELTHDEAEMLLGYWQYSGELEGLIPYLIPCEHHERSSLGQYLNELRQVYAMAVV
ncbi:hypothetical protein [Microscilla marina]|uniref:Uncharacterized protein n=1 Tax=Microscilla marina ATCC 23134 TaxID=313606 RepID=A1ZII9_MICM2|nr:hypothetical protein [Microscilla marina]EAY29857.1 hypothetical protein M23134_05730 [Microscilla marina ATCC 23134]